MEQEHLAIKLALEEWHHWLESIEQPFVVWIDHWKLGVTAKQNPCQAHWLFFFLKWSKSPPVLHGPRVGSHSLSQLHICDEGEPSSELILRSSIKFQQALSRQWIPATAWWGSSLFWTTCTSRSSSGANGSCHPDTSHTLLVLQPFCPTCTQQKSFKTLSAGSGKVNPFS